MRSSITILGGAALFAALGLASCTQTDALVVRDTGDASLDGQVPIFTAPDAGGDAADDAAPPSRLLCIATECPAPYASCGHEYPCDTDLTKNDLHCGACGNQCPSFPPLLMRSRCVGGACVLECMNPPSTNTDFRDCNGALDDGCEVDVFTDSKNCGVCGNACAAGERCHEGRCGCPPPLADCDGVCMDLANAPNSCGACGTVCSDPEDACPEMPFATMYGCSGGKCGQLVCTGGMHDCNHDLALGCASDGCEARLDDNANCGACGFACPSGTECRDEGSGAQCLTICDSPDCRCKPGMTLCPNGACVDLLHDRTNCGGCLIQCPLGRANQLTGCDKGVCAQSCVEGFADCNGNPQDGCEIDLQRDPTNRGACGNRCDTSAGQPCIEGKCAMKECAPGETK